MYQALTSDCYRPSLDQLDLNMLPMIATASTYPMQLSQSPMQDLAYQAMYALDLFGKTLPSGFTVDHITQEAIEDYQQEQDQDQEQKHDQH